MNEQSVELVMKALDKFKIELPSWGFANTGTRFGKFIQAAAATTIEEKFSDAGQVNSVTGACPTLALHVQWDLPNGLPDASTVERLAKKYGVRPGSINPNVFQDQEYKYGSLGNPDPAIRRKALRHILDCVAIAEALGCRDIVPMVRGRFQLSRYTEHSPKELAISRKASRKFIAALKPQPAPAGRIQAI